MVDVLVDWMALWLVEKRDLMLAEKMAVNSVVN